VKIINMEERKEANGCRRPSTPFYSPDGLSILAVVTSFPL
jgi:hypothetical protein